MPFIPETYYATNRKEVKTGLSPLQLAYVEKLEDALRAADAYEDAMKGHAHTPEQHALSCDLLVKMSKVNFLSSCDAIEVEDDLPRDIIFQ